MMIVVIIITMMVMVMMMMMMIIRMMMMTTFMIFTRKGDLYWPLAEVFSCHLRDVLKAIGDGLPP
jgi:hypothetical protein